MSELLSGKIVKVVKQGNSKYDVRWSVSENAVAVQNITATPSNAIVRVAEVKSNTLTDCPALCKIFLFIRFRNRSNLISIELIHPQPFETIDYHAAFQQRSLMKEFHQLPCNRAATIDGEQKKHRRSIIWVE
jgi:hypothetical protein